MVPGRMRAELGAAGVCSPRVKIVNDALVLLFFFKQ